MRKPIIMSLLAAGLVVSLSNPLAAQRRRGLVDVSPREGRHGFWMNLGAGAGTESYKFQGDNGFSQGITKPTLDLRLGGTVSPNFRLGGELIGWADRYYTDQGDRVTEYLAGLLLVGQFYPARDLGLFVKGGGGFSRSGTSVDGPYDNYENGFAWTVGAGYEIKLGRTLYLTPTVDFMQHRSRTRDEFGDLQPALYDRLVSFGVALTLQPGR